MLRYITKNTLKNLKTNIYPIPYIPYQQNTNYKTGLNNNYLKRNNLYNTPQRSFMIETGMALTACVVGTARFFALRYKIANPDEYLVRTGIFINDIDISKHAFHLPFQTLSRIKMEPITLN